MLTSFLIVSTFCLILTGVFYLTIRKKMPQKKWLHIVFLAVPLFFILGFLFFKFVADEFFGTEIQKAIVWFMWLFVLVIVPFLLFAIFYWLNLLIKFIFKINLKLQYFIALPLILIFLTAYFHGTYNANNLEVRCLTIEMENLPQEFDGLKIAVMGDTHIGNFVFYKKYFNKIGNVINSQNVDLLLFTGDLVQTSPKEGMPFLHYFNNLNAKYGKYAVMGNHDFCRYFDWSEESVRESMVYKVKNLYRAYGFTLLENDYVLLEKDSLNSVCIVGADETGNLQQTLSNCPQGIFSILLLHNTKKFQEQIAENKDVALTLSGHTHAWQCAFRLFGKKFSPSKWNFNHWEGLYNVDNQYFFVTRGVGYAGIPVRIGLKPEISILTLKKK